MRNSNGTASPLNSAASFSALAGSRLQTNCRCGCKRREMPEHQLRHLSGADAQNRFIVEMIEDALRIIDRDARDAQPAFAERRLVHHLLADGEGALKERMKQGPAVFDDAAQLIRAAHLPEDLRLAQYHRIERRCHGEQVLDCRPAVLLIKMRLKILHIDRMKIRKELRPSRPFADAHALRPTT